MSCCTTRPRSGGASPDPDARDTQCGLDLAHTHRQKAVYERHGPAEPLRRPGFQGYGWIFHQPPDLALLGALDQELPNPEA